MKRLAILVLNLIAIMAVAVSQNVGIGTTTPQYRLDVNGRMRIMSGGGINTAGLWLNNNANDATPAFIGMRYDSLTGFYVNIGGWRWLMNTNTGNIALGDFNPTRPLSFPATLEKKISLYPGTTGDAGFGVFGNELRINSDNSSAAITLGFDDYQNGFTERMRVKGNGNVGIGESNPGFPLNFSSTPGDKISLFGNSGAHYGFGIQGSLLQIHSAGSGDDIVFGYGSSSAFTERMRIKGNGNVGIGIPDPAYLLDIGGRMRIRTTPGFTAGLWLNNDANNASPAFIGMFSDTEVGFYGGGGSGWGFLMNTQTGAIRIGSSAGSAGQVLTSNGTAAAPSWQNAGGSSGLFIARQSGGASGGVTTNSVDLTSVVANFTLAVPSRVLFNYDARIFTQSCFACGEKRVALTLMKNVSGGSSEVARTTAFVPNLEFMNIVSGPAVFDLPAGTHSYKVSLTGSGTIVATADFGQLTWQIFPN